MYARRRNGNIIQVVFYSNTLRHEQKWPTFCSQYFSFHWQKCSFWVKFHPLWTIWHTIVSANDLARTYSNTKPLRHMPLCIIMILWGVCKHIWNAKVKSQVKETYSLKAKKHWQPLWNSLGYSSVWHHNATIATANNWTPRVRACFLKFHQSIWCKLEGWFRILNVNFHHIKEYILWILTYHVR